MKTLLFISFFILSGIIDALSNDALFKATVKNTGNSPIPRVYVKFYLPGQVNAVDSAFTNEQGVLERELKFVDVTSVAKNLDGSKSIIVREIMPNVISSQTSGYYLEYNYPLEAKLEFTNIYGRTYSNNSWLAAGVYYYKLQFKDGTQSETKKITVISPCNIIVGLYRNMPEKKHESRLKSALAPEASNKIFVDIIKDGYITKRDTFDVSSAIVKSYQLSEASKPVANFSYSGNMKVGQPLVFNGLASAGANNEQLIYAWDFGNGCRGQSAEIPHIFMAAGNYQVTLTVRGNYGAMHSITKMVSIAPGETSAGNTGKVKGFVMDTDAKSATGVSVSLVEGTSNGTTDNSGSITLSNLPLGIPLHFKLTKTGYVNQVVALTISPDKKEACFFATLKKRNNEFTFQNAEFGGKVNGNDGASMTLPVDALIKPDGSAVSGEIGVSVTPVDVSRQTGAFPGTFQAVRNNGNEVLLLSLGVTEFNFQQGGKQLQLAPGKTATILIPIYTSGAKAGDKIPLWSINENNGIWVEEGIGTVVASGGSPTGLALQAEIGHLSWWNCDDFRNGKDKDALCWRWECTTVQCYKVKVGCWMDGALPDDGSYKKSLEVDQSSKKSYHPEDYVPPVFEVRTFVSEGGNKLVFPEGTDIYLEAQGYGSKGELLKGNYKIKAGSLPDTIKVELSQESTADTIINLTLNTKYNYYLKKGKMVQFKLSIPQRNVYGFILEQGVTPKLEGMFSVIQSQVMIISGSSDGLPKYALLDKNQVLINVSGQSQNIEGNFSIQVLEPTPLTLNTTITDSLTTYQKIRFYSFKPDSNNILAAKFKTTAKVYGGQLKLYSQRNYLIKEAAVYEIEGSLLNPVSKDSIYFIEIYRRADCKFSLSPYYDEKYKIAYGDTIQKSIEHGYDIDLFYFKGKKDDFISLNAYPTDYELSSGTFELWDNEGHHVTRKSVLPKNYNDDCEILYILPSDGVYSVFIRSNHNDTGSYRIVLHNPTLNSILYNSVTKINILSEKEYYYRFDLSEKKLTHFSVISEKEEGHFDVWDKNFKRHSAYNRYHDYSVHGFFPLNDSLEAGNYFIKIANEKASAISLTLKEIKPLVFNSKGKAQFTDTIKTFTSNAYLLKGKPGDAYQAIVKRIDEPSVPNGISLFCHKLGDNSYLVTQGITYRKNVTTLDSTNLIEVVSKFPGSSGNLTWVITTRAEKQGAYDFNLHYVNASDSIAVDNDFNDCPGAHTSSLVGAGLAIKDNGKIYVANGTYNSYYPVQVNSKNVRFTGQQKEQVHIVNTGNYFHVMEFTGQGSSIKNITIRGGSATDAMILQGNNIVCENIDVKPFKDKMYGEIRGTGSNMIYRNIKLDNTIEGFNVGSDNGLMENCDITSEWKAVKVYGKPFKVCKNNILVTKSYEAIECGGVCICDSNKIEVRTTAEVDDQVIEIIGNTSSEPTESFMRHNTILTSQTSRAFWASAGSQASKILIENNYYKSTYSKGGKAFAVSNYTTQAGSVIIRNNVFEGITSRDAIMVHGMDALAKDGFMGIYNNSFRMSSGATKDTSYNFIALYKFGAGTANDTVRLYFANNIFQGNNFTYWVKLSANYSLYGDYNIVYNFRKYKNNLGNIIGKTHDIALDPLFTDDKLHIAPTSPAIDKGTSSALFPMLPKKDISGIVRPLGAAYDIGAYEVK